MLARILTTLVAVLLVSAASAPAQTLDKAERACATAKLKATGKKENAKLKCEAIALVKDTAATNADCLLKAEDKFANAFAKAELKGGCVSTLDAATVEGVVDDFVFGEVARQKMLFPPLLACDVLDQPCGNCGDGICAPTDQGQVCVSSTTSDFIPCPCAPGYACYHMIITPPFGGDPIDIATCLASCNIAEPPVLDKAGRLCAASKLKATGKNAFSKMKCEAKAIAKELATADPLCAGKADDKLGTAFEKAEGKGGCVSTGDTPAVEATADDFVAVEVSRQKEGVLLPGCSTPDASCGSCGTGMCLLAVDGLFCVDMSVTPTSPCPVEGCPAGTVCVNAGFTTACVAGCP